MKTPPEKTKSKTRILIAEDHPVTRMGMVQLINRETDLACCGEVESASAAMQAVERLKPDLLLLDLCLHDSDGLELIKSLRAQHAHLPILVLSQQDEALFAERTLRAGARGYVMKERATADVLEAIRAILAGEIYVSRKVAALAVHKLVEGKSDIPRDGSEVDALSDRELQVFRLLGAGKGTKEIAVALKLSHKTIETYRENIKHKLGLANATALVHRATEWVQGQTKPGSH